MNPYGMQPQMVQQRQFVQPIMIQQQPQVIQQPQNGAPNARAGDWLCPMCNNHNYASREQCNNKNCTQRKPLAAHAIISQPQPQYVPVMQQPMFATTPMNQQPMRRAGGREPRVGDWTCNKCNNLNYASREICNNAACDVRKCDVLRWVCPLCQNDNYPNREVCNRPHCQAPRPDDPELVNDRSEIGLKRSKPGDAGNWMCESCGNENYPNRTRCNKPDCRLPRPDDVSVSAKRARVGVDGFAVADE